MQKRLPCTGNNSDERAKYSLLLIILYYSTKSYHTFFGFNCSTSLVTQCTHHRRTPRQRCTTVFLRLPQIRTSPKN